MQFNGGNVDISLSTLYNTSYESVHNVQTVTHKPHNQSAQKYAWAIDKIGLRQVIIGSYNLIAESTIESTTACIEIYVRRLFLSSDCNALQ